MSDVSRASRVALSFSSLPSNSIVSDNTSWLTQAHTHHAWLTLVIITGLVLSTHNNNNNNNNNNNTQDDIYSAVYTAPAICESSLWDTWTIVGQRQVAANS